MSIIYHIGMQELKRMFKSTTAFMILAVIQFLSAIFFYVLLYQFLSPSQYKLAGGVTQLIIANMLQICSIIILVISPFTTMRLFAEEFRHGTIYLLRSSPISITQMVLGKYLGITLFNLILLCLISLMPLSLMFGTSLDMGQVVAAFLGLLLMLCAFSSVGLFMSSLTQQPATAAIMTFGVLFLLWIMNIGNISNSGNIAAIFSYLSLLKHYNNLLNGIFNFADVAYYLLISIFFIVTCIWHLDSQRING